MCRILYLECNSGISGDMFAGAMLDLGADEKKLQAVLDSVPAHGFTTRFDRVLKHGIDCGSFDVVLEHAETHDHDMEYLFGDPEDGHHEHDHDHEHHHSHVHRTWADVRKIIDGTSMDEGARKLAYRIFEVIARAESKAHHVPADQVHFHEVGALDSIVDVISAAVLFTDLKEKRGITDVLVPSVSEGQGQVRTMHGVLPVPVPAVLNICEATGLPISRIPDRGEFVTPTGAAIAGCLMTGNDLPARFRVLKTGYGAGKREYERPNFLRAQIIESADSDDRIWKLETNVDDSRGEQMGYLVGKLLETGARDAFFTPVYMKKNRPGILLTVICDEEKIPELEHLIFLHSTTIGIRRCPMDRTILEREILQVSTEYGVVRVKRVSGADGILRYYPEYADVAACCDRNESAGFDAVYQAAVREASK